MAHRLLQLTDLHLFADPAAELKGTRTRDSFQRVWERVEAEFGDVDRLVITGDLAHDELPETYAVLRDQLGAGRERCLLIPGNHDNQPAMQAELPQCFPGEAAHAGFSTTLGGWRLIGLSTQIAGEVAGRLGEPQLAWLGDELAQHSEQPTVLFLHHPPISVETDWLDRIGLEDAATLESLVQQHAQVTGMFCGHVHMDFSGELGNVPVFSTPATSLQFKPQTLESTTDDLPPGFRVIVLEGDRLLTRVVRLEND